MRGLLRTKERPTTRWTDGQSVFDLITTETKKTERYKEKCKRETKLVNCDVPYEDKDALKLSMCICAVNEKGSFNMDPWCFIGVFTSVSFHWL